MEEEALRPARLPVQPLRLFLDLFLDLELYLGLYLGLYLLLLLLLLLLPGLALGLKAFRRLDQAPSIESISR